MIELCDNNSCTGCGACYNICPKNAITMFRDNEGFLRPSINHERCIECHLCQKACPPLNPVKKHPKTLQPIALINKSKDILLKSTSGGVFSLIAEWILQQGGVIFGVEMDSEFNIYHSQAENPEEIQKFRGSKYAQSDTKKTFAEVKSYLKQSRPVLYTGTPCQIAGLSNYLRGVDCRLLYTADIVCHGTPSNTMLQTYISKLAQQKGLQVSDIKKFQFRLLEQWGSYNASFEYNAKRQILKDADNVYLSLFFSARLQRPCCYSCPYTSQERVSDITIADFWGIGKNKPFNYETKNGCSLVLTNTEKGKNLFDQISQYANYEYREWDEALAVNHQLHTPTLRPRDREKAIHDLFEKSIGQTYNHFFNSPQIKCRKILSKFLRIILFRK